MKCIYVGSLISFQFCSIIMVQHDKDLAYDVTQHGGCP